MGVQNLSFFAPNSDYQYPRIPVHVTWGHPSVGDEAKFVAKKLKDGAGIYRARAPKVDKNTLCIHDTDTRFHVINSEKLGNTAVSQQGFEHPDGTKITLNWDYFDNPRDPANPFPGPLEIKKAASRHKVWPKNHTVRKLEKANSERAQIKIEPR